MSTLVISKVSEVQMNSSESKQEQLSAIWEKIESRLDEQVDPGEANSIFDNGVWQIAPDLIDLAAGLEPDLNKGTLLTRYRIIKTLGSGGMGDVYLAERADGQYKKQVALKIMSMGLASPVLLHRFKREMQILAELNHPGIATLLDAGIAEDGRPWFVLDYIEGIPLTEFCETKHLPEKSTLKLFIHVCDAIAHAHYQGIVHRDLKPANILVEGDSKNPKPVVLDFGIASKEQDRELTKAENILGTPAYSSPEQAAGNHPDLDQRSDIFSLGILLYELIDGHKPFCGDNNTEISYQIIHIDTPALQQSGISPDLSAIIFKCLNKPPEQRYSSVPALIDDLENYLQGRSVYANPVGPWFRFKRRVRRYPATSALIGITLATFILLGLVSVWQNISKQHFAAQQAKIAQHFGQASQEIIATSQLIYSRPLHNIETELQTLIRQYKNLKQKLTSIAPSSQHVAEYALGQAALRLGLLDDARHYLENAWKSGLDDQLLSLHLGQVYIQQYGKAIQGMSMLSDPGEKKQLLAAAEKDYLLPAKNLLSTYTEFGNKEDNIAKALLTKIGGNPEQALTILQRNIDKSPWPVSALITAGDIHLESSEQALFTGDSQVASRHLLEAKRFFMQATEIARSHPEAISGHCVSNTKLIQTNNYQQFIQNQTDQLLLPCRHLQILRPKYFEYLLQSGQAYTSLASLQLTHGDTPSESITEARQLITNALQKQPDSPRALRLSGVLYLVQANWFYESGQDGDKLLSAALAAFRQAANAAPDNPLLLGELVTALHRASRMEYANGSDGNSSYKISNQIQQRLIARDDAPLSTWIRFANGLSWQAYYLYSSGRDAEPVLNKAIGIAQQALTKQPQNLDAIKAMAMATWTYAEFNYLKNEDPRPWSDQAFSHYGSVIEQDPENYVARINQLGPMTLAIDFSLDRKQPQQQQLKLMLELLQKLEENLDDKFETQLLWADYWRHQAKQALIDHQNPTTAIETARHYLQEALGAKIDRYEAVQSFGRLSIFEHHWRAKTGDQNVILLQQDIATLGSAIEDFPDLPILKAQRGRLRMLNANRPHALIEGQHDIATAIRENPLLKHRYSGYLTKNKSGDKNSN